MLIYILTFIYMCCTFRETEIYLRSVMNAADVALICKALGDSNRLQIVELLSTGEKCACKMLEKFEITQPTLSHHMKILRECDLINVRKEGKWMHYSLNCETLSTFRDYIQTLSCEGSKRSECGC